MAITTVKTTYALDVGTVRALEALARRWGVSKSEALRRAIRAAVDHGPQPEQDTVEALNKLQRSLRLTPAKARAWADRTRTERRASSARRETRAK